MKHPPMPVPTATRTMDDLPRPAPSQHGRRIQNRFWSLPGRGRSRNELPHLAAARDDSNGGLGATDIDPYDVHDFL